MIYTTCGEMKIYLFKYFVLRVFSPVSHTHFSISLNFPFQFTPILHTTQPLAEQDIKLRTQADEKKIPFYNHLTLCAINICSYGIAFIFALRLFDLFMKHHTELHISIIRMAKVWIKATAAAVALVARNNFRSTTRIALNGVSFVYMRERWKAWHFQIALRNALNRM